MFIKNNAHKILKVFLDDSTEEFGLRELSRLAGVSPASTKKYLDKLIKEEIIKKITRKNYPMYIANRDSNKFKVLQKNTITYELESTGLLNYLWENLSPKAIILYGGFQKGEATKDSDIDLFIVGKDSKIDLERYEKKIGRKLHLFFQKELTKTPKELKNNIINGSVLRGYLRI